jgi:hypothetical protein
MMKETKGFVRETETFQYIKKPNGFDRVHFLLGRQTTFSKPALDSWRKVEEAKTKSCFFSFKPLKSLALPRGIEPLFQP